MKNKLLQQLLMVTKFSLYIFLVQITSMSLLIAADGKGQSVQSVKEARTTISFNNERVTDVFKKLETLTGYSFSYNESDIRQDTHVSGNYQDFLVYDILLDISRQTNIKFQQINKNINAAVAKDKKALQKKSVEVVQEIRVKGKVTADDGSALPGVNVLIKGTNNGTITDIEGGYTIVANDNSILVFSFMGFLKEEVPVNGREIINITLIEDVQSLQEVVVVGYGEQEKKDITGSVSSISSESIKDIPVSNFEQALKGQAAGVQVTQNTGSPSSGVSIRVRGNGSISAGNGPLYVIDGFPVGDEGSRGQGGVPGGGNPLNSINPNDIESIDILKDASATAIYGSRGANGVVIITTKTGKAGKSTLNLDMFTGWQTATRKLDVLSPEEFAEYHIESRENGWLQSGGNPDTPYENRGRFRVTPMYLDPEQWQRTDWQDEVLRTGIIRNFNLSATGGTENIRYSISGGHFKNEGIIIGSSMDRYSFRANIDTKINERMKAGIRFTTAYTINDQVATEGHFRDAIVGMALRMPPIVGPYEEDGSYTNPLAMRNPQGLGSLGAVDNPVANAHENHFNLDQGRLMTNAFMEYEITKNLKFRSSLGVDFNANRSNIFYSSLTGRSGTPPPNVTSGSASSAQDLTLLNENLLTYTKTFAKLHKVTAIAGYSAQKNDYRNMRVDGRDYLSDNVPYLRAAGIVESGTEIRNQWSMLSYFSRVNYSYNDKYLLTATIRRDGSSRFGRNNKYGTFPSAAVGWRMSEENFMKNISVVDNFKWRASYGISGNNDIPRYQHVPNMTSAGYALGGAYVNGIAPGRLSNPYVTWETNRSWNLGVDIGLFESRIGLSAEVYQSNTDGLLLNVNIPSVAGFTSTLENVGEVENKGLEIALNTVNTTGEFKWNSSFNITFNRNKILALGGAAGDFIDVGNARNVVGNPMGMFYLRVTDGIFNNWEEVMEHVPQDNNPQPGYRRFKDVNGDGVVNNDDRDFVGNPNPDFIFGITNNFSYKGFALNILMNGSFGNDVYYKYATGANLNGNLNQDGVIRDRWRSEENPGSGNIPSALFGYTTLSDVDSDFFIHDGSFLRITNVTFSYTFPRHMLESFKVQNVRTYISGQNLFTFTTYPGYDPEIASSGNNPLYFGNDAGVYPMSKVITLGVNVTF